MNDETTADQDRILNDSNLLRSLIANPKTRKSALSIIKEAYPDHPIPELDVQADLDARVSARVEPVLAENKVLVGRLEKMERLINRSMFAGENALDEEEMVEVEKFATTHKIGDGKWAVEAFRALGTPRGTPRSDADVDYRGDLAKAAAQGPSAIKAAVQKQADRVLREMRGGRVR